MALIILAHPNYNQSVANKAIIDYISKHQPDFEIRNLSERYPNYQIDIEAEQQALLKHHTIIFQYPLYWYNMPAILKQYFDCVLTYGFAYGNNSYRLKDKFFIPSITVGASEEDYRADGEAHFRVLEFCKNLEQTAYYTKMKYIDPMYFHGTSPVLFTPEKVREKAEIYAKKLSLYLSKFNDS